MLTVRTFLQQAGNKGIGLFAKENIKANDVIWQRNTDFDKVFYDVSHCNDILKELIETYATLEFNNNLYLCVDNARFMNHSNTPNLTIIKNENLLVIQMLAKVDINIGDEITCDYREICEACKTSLGFENKEETRADGLQQYYLNKQIKFDILESVKAALKVANYSVYTGFDQLRVSMSFMPGNLQTLKIRYINIILDNDTFIIDNKESMTPKNQEVTIEVKLSNPNFIETIVQECDKIMESYK